MKVFRNNKVGAECIHTEVKKMKQEEATEDFDYSGDNLDITISSASDDGIVATGGRAFNFHVGDDIDYEYGEELYNGTIKSFFIYPTGEVYAIADLRSEHDIQKDSEIFIGGIDADKAREIIASFADDYYKQEEDEDSVYEAAFGSLDDPDEMTEEEKAELDEVGNEDKYYDRLNDAADRKKEAKATEDADSFNLTKRALDIIQQHPEFANRLTIFEQRFDLAHYPQNKDVFKFALDISDGIDFSRSYKTVTIPGPARWHDYDRGEDYSEWDYEVEVSCTDIDDTFDKISIDKNFEYNVTDNGLTITLTGTMYGSTTYETYRGYEDEVDLSAWLEVEMTIPADPMDDYNYEIIRCEVNDWGEA